MATSDPLLLLRAAILSSRPPLLTTTDDPTLATSPSSQVTADSFAQATHLYFSSPPYCVPLTTVTRFTSATPDTTAVDLRSVYFAWLQKDVTVPEYIASAAELDRQLPEGQHVRNLVFVERLDLITWLEGASDESEYIAPLAAGLGIGGEGQGGDITGVGAGAGAGAASATAATVADVAAGAGVPKAPGTGVGVTQHTPGGRPVKVIDARLQEIYNGERKMGDHNTVLRGIKPTDFSHVRKHTEAFLGRHRKAPATQPARPGHPSRPAGLPSTQLANRPAPGVGPGVPKPAVSAVSSKRSDPIILLSPSASSLLRLSNIRSFLESGLFVPPDHPTLSSQTTANLLHITRALRSISERPFRFIIVDSPEQFKPDYWARVVAVFTTGQTWQFRGYKWREPQELFGHVLGVYVGEKGAPVPGEVKGWGSSVRSFTVERWDERAHGTGVDPPVRDARRWRDRETVEEVWRAIEAYMRGKPEWRR